MNNLDEFGKELMKLVRDESILTWESILAGNMKGLTAVAANTTIRNSATPEEAIRALLPDIVNTVIHRLLAAVDGNERMQLLWLQSDVSELSDGLPGELASPKGWIAKYSMTNGGMMAK